MKLIMENWRSAVEKWKEEGNEDKYGLGDKYQGTNIQPESVQILMPPIAYPFRGRLITVASWKGPTGRAETFAFYSSTGDTTSGMSFSRGWWLPFMGLGKDGWLIKLREKYPHPSSILGQVAQAIGKKYPPEVIQSEYMKQNKEHYDVLRDIRRKAKQSGRPTGTSEIRKQIQDEFIPILNKQLENYGAFNYQIGDCLKKCHSDKRSNDHKECNTECYEMFGHSEWKSVGSSWI